MRTIPPFRLPGSDGRTWTQNDLLGRITILYLYPRDMTPGCTAEACDFRDRHAELVNAGILLLGVSGDSLDRHAQFIAKERLPFVLLSDPEHQLVQALGAWKQKNMYGKKTFGIERSTFLIDRQGNVAREWRKVKVEGHVAEVLHAACMLARVP
ncbi:MAG: peroxiredoxin [Planctomycetota bacterium]|nr:peroxiredoxin [Planctomycetota bacterium]MDW8372990.1 peroxiredoxin [Planctomycetota bacterium]